MSIEIRRLSEDETTRFFPRGVGAPQAEYIDALRELRIGDSVEANRGTVTSRAFKRRMTLAAKHLGMELRYARDTSDTMVRFMVRAPRQPSTGSGDDAPRRRGRPPKIRTA